MKHAHDIISQDAEITILAGRGQYPVILSMALSNFGREFSVIAVDDEIDRDWFDRLDNSHKAFISVGQLGKMLSWLQRFKTTHVIMAGQVKPKKLFHGMIPDLKAMLLLARLKEKNAETIFGAIVQEISSLGIDVLDARSFLEDSLASDGLMTATKLSVSDNDVTFGINIAREVARLNIGQSVVVNNGTVVAVEDFAGTDDLIRRVGNFKLKNGIFIKTTVVNKDFRFDVPVFGMTTLDNLRNSRIRNVILESQRVIILNKDNVLQRADEYKIAITGVAE